MWEGKFLGYFPSLIILICDFYLKLGLGLKQHRKKRLLDDLIETLQVIHIYPSVFQLNFKAIIKLLHVFDLIIVQNGLILHTLLSKNPIEKLKIVLELKIQILLPVYKDLLLFTCSSLV